MTGRPRQLEEAEELEQGLVQDELLQPAEASWLRFRV